mgnify:CR=1 FL=1
MDETLCILTVSLFNISSGRNIEKMQEFALVKNRINSKGNTILKNKILIKYNLVKEKANQALVNRFL